MTNIVKAPKVDVNTPEWIQDFKSKNERLGQLYTATPAVEIYRTVFGDVTKERPIFLRDINKTVIAKDYNDILNYIEDNDTVFVYLQEFRKSYSRKHDSIDTLYGFIVDIDGIRSYNLQEIIDLIDAAPLKPNLIVSSGNGVHLYFLFDNPFQFYNYTYCMAILSFKADIRLSRKGAFGVIKKIHKKVCSWFKKENQDYTVDVLHLSQPLRMCGAKTKNNRYRTEGFVVTDHRIGLEDLSELVRVTLIDEELLPLFKARDPQYIEEHAAYLNEIELADEAYEADRIIRQQMARDFVSSYIKNPDIWREKGTAHFMNDINKEQGCVDVELEVDAEEEVVAGCNPKKERKAYSSLYYETVRRIRAGATVGHRQKLLHVLCSRAAMHGMPVEIMARSAKETADYFTSLDPEKPIRDCEVTSALLGYEKRWKYSNQFILDEYGVDLNIDNQETIRRDKNRSSKSEKLDKILAIADFIFQENPDTSFREFHKTLVDDYGVKISRGWVTDNTRIREIKSKYMRAKLG